MSARFPRVFLAEAPLPDGTARPDPEESHHLVRVLRARPGEAVLAFDGRGGEWEARIRDVDRGLVTLVLGRATGRSSESPVAVQLVQALVRPEKLDYVLQKGTEIGVAAFLVVPTERAEAPAPSPQRLARYRRVLLEACKQSGRLVVPSLAVGAWPPEPAPSIVLDPAGAPIGAVLSRGRASEAAIAIGPEGGFTEREVETLRTQGATAASLGPRVLRTETAGVVAAALVLHAWGDLGAI
jgi:16S rRNA (uracil1498-N3)-methyltransferase